MMKRNKNNWMAGLSLVLSGFLAFGHVIPVTAESTAYGQYVSGEEAVENQRAESEYTVIVLSSEEELRKLAQDCGLDSWSRDKYIKLADNIELQEEKSLVIPSFGGIFDGCGYSISGLDIDDAGSSLGLFRYVQAGGTVRNLTVSGSVCPDGSSSQVGLLAGVNYGKIISCSVSGTVTGAEKTGGIAGVNESSGEIRNCQSAAIVTGNHYTGGICGINIGTLNNCENSGSINTYSLDVTYDLEDIENIARDGLEEIDRMEQVAAHTDTGGITGYSEGKIYYCSNSGTVGYQHVGYNTGGIVGRLHQGYLQNCTNTGHILGRKDVGGIAGQMEPFLEIQYLNDALSEIDREAETFFDLLEAAQEDLDSYGGQAGDLARSISGHLRNVSAAAGNLLNTGNDLWYIYNQELTGIQNDLNRLNQEWSDQAAIDRDKADQNKGDQGSGDQNNGDQGSGDQNNTDQGSGDQNNADPDGTDQNSGSGTESERDWPHFTVSGNEVIPPQDSWNGSLDVTFPVDVESYLAALRRFGEGTSSHLSNITGATNDRSGGINDNLAVLNSEMSAAGSELQQLADVLDQGGSRLSGNVDALIAQGKVLRRSISGLRDELFRYEGISVEDHSDEAAGGEGDNLGADPQDTGAANENPADVVSRETDTGEGEASDPADAASGEAGAGDTESAETASGEAPDPMAEIYYDTSSFQQGKITLCINKGMVEADTNVGGIAGQIATEYDFDPEDDITISGVESFHIEQSVKAVIRESRNLGDITGKKDYVGGVVGKADYGAVISCESYGRVESTGGSYVGGIAGASGYCVRSCYSMGGLSGKNYVGGIVGSGCDVFYSYAYPELEYSGEYVGSIAGKLREEGILFGNFYVQGNIPGVDSIGYEGGATPLDYQAFCSSEGVPEAFSLFTVSFQADGKELASYQCKYGEALDRNLIPEIPQKDGYYGIWPEFDYDCIIGNKVLEADYEKWITSLASEEKDEKGRTLLLAEGQFLPETRLVLEQKEEEITFFVGTVNDRGQITDEYTEPVTVRTLCENQKGVKVELWDGNSYRQVSADSIGSYLKFSMEKPGTFRIVYPEKDNGGWMIAAAVGAGAVVLVLVLVLIKRGSRKKSIKQAEKRII